MMKLSEKLSAYCQKSTPIVTAGFDAVIDSIVRPVMKVQKNERVFFSEINQFGDYLKTKSGLSCMVELASHQTKIGGNMANFSNAIAELGANVTCVGTMGYPEINPIFRSMKARLISVCETGSCTALEFNDGKIMLSHMDETHSMDWNCIKERVDKQLLTDIFTKPDLIALLNWSEIIHTTKIWQGILNEVLSSHKRNKEQVVCFDLTDFSSKSDEDVLQAVKCMNEFSCHFKTVASFNLGEAKMLYKVLFKKDAPDDCFLLGNEIYQAMDIDSLVIHPRANAYGFEKGESFCVDGFPVDKPLISTGGGDNFNAGLCYALTLGFKLDEALKIGCAVSGYYVRNAKSPSLQQLMEFLQKQGL